MWITKGCLCRLSLEVLMRPGVFHPLPRLTKAELRRMIKRSEDLIFFALSLEGGIVRVAAVSSCKRDDGSIAFACDGICYWARYDRILSVPECCLGDPLPVEGGQGVADLIAEKNASYQQPEKPDQEQTRWRSFLLPQSCPRNKRRKGRSRRCGRCERIIRKLDAAEDWT